MGAAQDREFNSLYSHGFVRVTAAVPQVRVADPSANVERILALARRSSECQAALVAFPELGISAYTNEDLFHQEALLTAVESSLERLVVASTDLMPVLVVGAPLRVDNGLFNTAIVIHRGRILGIVPKSYLPNYREFYEKRHFSAARDAISSSARLPGNSVAFGPDLLFECHDVPGFVLHVEVCEDLWVPIPPSTYASLGGATILVNISASNVTVGKADYRRQLCASQSARTLSAYIYTAANGGESTTDLAWDGHALVYEDGECLAESSRFTDRDQMVAADVDLGRLIAERIRMTSFSDCAHDHKDRIRALRRAGTGPARISGTVIVPVASRREYTVADIKRWLRVFLERFFHTSQFKRSAIPNGPKVGSGGSLSPRGDWRAPSDSSATTWLEELELNTPDTIP